MTKLVVDVIHEPRELACLAPEWRTLLGRSNSDGLFSTFEWLHTAWLHLGGGRELCVRTVRRGGELLAVAPFSVRGPDVSAHPVFGCIELLGAGEIGSDYGDLVVARGAEEACLDALAAHFGREHDAFCCRRVREEGCLLVPLFERLGERHFALEVRPDEVAPFIRFRPGGFEAYLATLRPRHRHAFRRLSRLLSKAHEVRFEEVGSEAERGPALATFLALHTARWRERGDPGAFARPELRSFHEAMSALALRRGWLRLQTLRLDGQAVAAVYGFRYRDTFYYYQTGFDPAFAASSVGLVACGLSIQRAVEQGALEFDFLHGAEDYKRRWASSTRALVRLVLYPPGARGWAYRQAVRVEREGRRLARRALDVARGSRGGLRAPGPVAEVEAS